MDFDGFQKFATQNLTDYFQTSVQTLGRPGSYFDPVSVPPEQRRAGTTDLRLDPQLMAFAATSMFVGLTTASLITTRPGNVQMLRIEIVGLIFWYFYAALVHFFCVVVRGRGRFMETISVVVQMFATLYALCSALTIVFALAVRYQPVAQVLSGLGDIAEMTVDNPATFFFVADTVLLMIYLPLSLKRVHGFGVIRQLAVAIPTVAIVLAHGVAMLYLTGDLWSAIPPTTP